MNEINKQGVCAIILAGGIGSRMRSDTTKQRMTIFGKTVLYRAVEAFQLCQDVDSIVVVSREEEIDFAREELAGIDKQHRIVPGGAVRAESARAGFAAIPDGTAFVAIHDAARPMISPEAISGVIAAAKSTGAATAVSVVTDTIKRVDDNGMIVETLSRDTLRRAETPQIFSVSLYKRACEACGAAASVTDDNMMLESIGVPVKTVDVGRTNIKITTPEDIKYIEFLLGER